MADGLISSSGQSDQILGSFNGTHPVPPVPPRYLSSFAA
jgi:hypothetical protein